MLWFESAPLFPPLCRCDQNRIAFTGLSYLDRPKCVKVNPVGQCVFFEPNPPAPAKASRWKRLRIGWIRRHVAGVTSGDVALFTIAIVYFWALSKC